MDMKKLIRVIDSCKNIYHVESAKQYLSLFCDKYEIGVKTSEYFTELLNQKTKQLS